MDFASSYHALWLSAILIFAIHGALPTIVKSWRTFSVALSMIHASLLWGPSFT